MEIEDGSIEDDLNWGCDICERRIPTLHGLCPSCQKWVFDAVNGIGLKYMSKSRKEEEHGEHNGNKRDDGG